MSVNVRIDGLEGLVAEIEKMANDASFKWPEEILNESSELMADAIRDEAKGSIKNSIRVDKTLTKHRVIVTSPHAVHVNDGTYPSPGRYVPAIGRRLVDRRRNIGMHPGIRASHFFDRAVEMATPRIFGLVHRKLNEYLFES